MAKASRNRKYTRKTQAASATPLLALALEACGGGGGGVVASNSDDPDPPVGGSGPITRSGWVLDGPILGARVYVDADSNGILSPGDIQIGDRTNADGYYSGTIDSQYENELLLVDLSGATDLGDPNVEKDKYEKDFTTGDFWRAPADSRIISPLTHVLTYGGVHVDGVPIDKRPNEIDITEFNPYADNTYTLEELKIIIAGMAAAEVIRQVQHLRLPFTTNYIDEGIRIDIGEIERLYDSGESFSTILDAGIDDPPREIEFYFTGVTLPAGATHTTTADYTILTISEENRGSIHLANIRFTDDDGGYNVASVADNGIFEIKNNTQLSLKSGASLDYETVQQHRITVSAKNNLELKEVFILRITNAIENKEGVTDNQLNPIEVEVYENNPIHKAVYDLKDLHAEIDGFILPRNKKDNELFELDANGRIWFKAIPDFEARRDSNQDNIYEIEVTRTEADNSITTSLINVEVKNIDLERTYSGQSLFTTGGVSKQEFFPRHLAAANQPELKIQEMLLGGIWLRDSTLTSTDPLTLTWSLKVDNASPGYSNPFSDEPGYTNLPPLGLNDQAGIENAREDLERSFAVLEDNANLKFIEVGEDANGVGDISIQLYQTFGSNRGNVLMNYGSSTNAHPAAMKFAVSNNYNFVDEDRGGSYYLVLHEILHSVGFGHPFESHAYWPGDFNRYQDSKTLSSYNQDNNYAINGDLPPLDIEVLQYLYGVKDEEIPSGIESELLTAPRPVNAPPTGMRLSKYTTPEPLTAGIQSEAKMLTEVIFTDSDGDPFGYPTNRVTLFFNEVYSTGDSTALELRNNDVPNTPPELWLKEGANLIAGNHTITLTATTKLRVTPPTDIFSEPTATLQETFTLVVEGSGGIFDSAEGTGPGSEII